MNFTGRPMKTNPQPPFQGSIVCPTKLEYATLLGAKNCSAKREETPLLQADTELRFLLASAQRDWRKLIGSTLWRSNAHPINGKSCAATNFDPLRRAYSTANFSLVEKKYVTYPVPIFAQTLFVCAPCIAEIFLEQPVAHDQPKRLQQQWRRWQCKEYEICRVPIWTCSNRMSLLQICLALKSSAFRAST
jgi:hypothetical protein